MHRFFVEKDEIKDGYVLVTGSDHAHMDRVLRLRVGDCIAVCDGAGSDYDGEIISFQKDGVIVALKNQRNSVSELEFEITLFQ